jgi:hypothetical protein
MTARILEVDPSITSGSVARRFCFSFAVTVILLMN